jgi:hypothetical protein
LGSRTQYDAETEEGGKGAGEVEEDVSPTGVLIGANLRGEERLTQGEDEAAPQCDGEGGDEECVEHGEDALGLFGQGGIGLWELYHRLVPFSLVSGYNITVFFLNGGVLNRYLSLKGGNIRLFVTFLAYL